MSGFWDETVPISPDNLNRATVPVGGIIMYSGSIAELPAGWALCDGGNGTPDLRDRFVVGAEGAYSQGTTGGADTVALSTSQLPSHSHGSGSLAAGNAGGHSHRVYSPIPTGPAGDRILDTAWNSDDRSASSTPDLIEPAGSHGHSVSGSTGSTGSGNAHENRPPYYALALIMRVA